MKILSFDKSTLFTFFLLDPVYHTDVKLSPYAAKLLASCLSQPERTIQVTQFSGTRDDKLFSYLLHDFFELVAAGYFLPCITTNN